MSQEIPPLDPQEDPRSGRLLIHVLLQFLMAVRYRKNVVIAALVFSSLLGALYYMTATRYYSAKAGMLMMQTGIDANNTSMASQFPDQQGLMKTFESVIKSPKVMEGVLARLRPEDRVDLAGVGKDGWASVLQAMVTTKIVPTTNILEVSFRSKNPVVAVNVVNAIVDSYLVFLDKTHKGATAEINNVLTKEHAELTRKLQAKQEELVRARSFFGDMGSKAGGEVLNPVIKRAIYFTDQLNEVQRKRIELQASLAAIQSAMRNGEDMRQHLITAANTVGNELMLRGFGLSANDTRTRASLEEQLLADRAEIEAMQRCVGPAHPQMIAKQEKIRFTEQFLNDYQQRSADAVARLQSGQLGPMLLQMVQQKLDETLRQEASLQAQFDSSRSEAVELNGRLASLEILEHDVERMRGLGDALVKQIASMDLRQDGQEVRAAVIDPPVVLNRPVSPKLHFVLFLAIAGGLGLGLTAVYVLDILDDRFRSVEDMQRQLGVPILAMIRQMSMTDETGPQSLELYSRSTSAESEAFRTLRTALALSDEHLRRLVITSSEPGDGKTTVLANLAVCYAQSGKKTLLIDADMRRPGMTNLMQLRHLEGLSNLLRCDAPVAETATRLIQASGVENLDVLPCGARPNNPAELLISSQFAELIDWATSIYDLLLIDSPPTLATSDAAVIGRQVDGAIMVIQPDKNRRHAVIRAVEGLLSMRVPLLGLVLNRIGSNKDQGYYGYGSGYGYGYGYGYGHDSDEEETEATNNTLDDFRDNPLEPQPIETDPHTRIVPQRAA